MAKRTCRRNEKKLAASRPKDFLKKDERSGFYKTKRQILREQGATNIDGVIIDDEANKECLAYFEQLDNRGGAWTRKNPEFNDRLP